MNLKEFLETVVTCPEPEGWFILALAPRHQQGWWEEWYRWPEQIDEICDKALTFAEECNVYFSSYLFKEPSSVKSNVLPTRTIQVDLDDADLLTLPIQPTILVQTSVGRHQGYWILREKWVNTDAGDHKIPINPLDPEAHEVLSRKLTYAIRDADTSGWPLGRKVRVPYTFNFKYLEGAQQITISTSTGKLYSEDELELLSDPPMFLSTEQDVDFLDQCSDAGIVLPVGPQTLLNTSNLPPSVKSQYNTRQQDRSRALWSLLCSAFRAGLSRDEVWWLGWHSANNKLSDLKYHAERELAKDVLRAESQVKSKIPDARQEVEEARRLQGATHERRGRMFQIVLNHMKASGEFVHTLGDVSYYIQGDLGRPITISPHSEWLDMVLDIRFGLNNTETDKQYVGHGINNFCRSLPVNGRMEALSWYDQDNHALLLHTGRREVIRITSNEITRTTDGAYGVVFPWGQSNEPFTPTLNYTSESDDWADIMFKSAVNNIIGIEPEHAQALLRVWFLFLLFRSTSISRPIIAFFGQPGSGKTTLFRRIYTLLYGRQRSVIGVTTADNFDTALASDPFVVLDNVDAPERWLPDRLAVAVSPSDIPKRKLYTDGDQYVLTRQALVGLTAHNPHFTREDVADRLLLFTFSRLKKHLPEGDILQDIYQQRNRIWGQIVRDCQRVLATPLPNYSQVPDFRIADFARTGYWIADALGLASEFSEALKHVGKDQKSLNLEQDAILVQTIQIFMRRSASSLSNWRTAGELWTELGAVAPDQAAFQRVYRNAVHFGKKLWSLQDSLKEIIEIEYRYDSTKGVRTWRLGTPSPNGAINGSKDTASHSVPG